MFFAMLASAAGGVGRIRGRPSRGGPPFEGAGDGIAVPRIPLRRYRAAAYTVTSTEVEAAGAASADVGLLVVVGVVAGCAVAAGWVAVVGCVAAAV